MKELVLMKVLEYGDVLIYVYEHKETHKSYYKNDYYYHLYNSLEDCKKAIDNYRVDTFNDIY